MDFKSVILLSDRREGKPYLGSLGWVNFCLRRAFERQGQDFRYRLVKRPLSAFSSIPVDAAINTAAILQESAEGGLRLYMEQVLDYVGLMPVTPPAANVVFLHGLRYNPGVFLGGLGSIDGICANSVYIESIVKMLLHYPTEALELPKKSRDIFIGHVDLSIPCVELPDGYPSLGEPIPPEVDRILQGDFVIGHAIRPGKINPLQTARILRQLCGYSRQATGKQVRLLVSQGDLHRIQQALKTLKVGYQVARSVIGVPQIDNRALTRLMRACQFALAYDSFPEPFGFYVLESVWNGTPVFTNGAGNLRYLLPAGHGVYVEEPEDLELGSESEQDRAARTIAVSIIDRISSGEGREACNKGRGEIRRRHSRVQMERSLNKFLKNLTERKRSGAPIGWGLSPMVRRWNPATQALLSDHASLRLEAEAARLIERLEENPTHFSLRGDQKCLRLLLTWGVLGPKFPPRVPNTQMFTTSQCPAQKLDHNPFVKGRGVRVNPVEPEV